ncbi:MAG: hypothetical protein ACE5F1_18045, partial [Planctomycetota bacterium]
MKCRWALLLLGAGCMPARPDSTEAQAPLTELIQRLDREIRERRQSEEEKQSRDELRQELEREIESEFEMRLDPAERKLESMIARLSEAASERETRERRDAETHAKIQQTFGELEALAKKLGDAVETDRKERAQLERSVLRLGDRLRRQPAELDRKLDAMHETLASDFGETLRDEHSSFRQQLEQKLRRLEKVLKKSNEEGSTRDGALSEKIAALASSVQELSIELDENERSAKASRDAAKLEREALERTAATRSGELKTVSAELGKLGARVAAESERRRRAESELGGRLDALAEIVSHGLQTLEGRLERRASRMEDAAKDGSTEKSNRQELAKSRDENEEPAGPEAGKREPGPGSVLGGGPALEPDIWEHPLSLAAGGLVLLLLLYLLFRREELEPAGQAEPSQAVPEAA